MSAPSPITFTDDDIPKNLSKKDHEKVMAFIKPTHDAGSAIDNSAMLNDITNRKYTTSDRIRTLFCKNNFSPIAKLLKLCQIEEAKMEAWNRAIASKLDPRLMEYLPKPDKKFYATLLIQLAKYEGPELKSVELTGEIHAGISITVRKHTPANRVVKIDGKSPEKLRLLHGSVATAIDVVPETVPVEVMDDI